MPPPRDLTGYRPPGARLTARHAGHRGGKRVWFCDCDCGAKDIPVVTEKLLSGNTRSCGCLQRDIAGINCRSLHVSAIPARCGQCGAFFRRTNAKQVYCDRRCKEDAAKFPATAAACEACGKPYFRGRSTQRYCSAACRKLGPMAARTRTCVECGKPFIVKKGAPVTCSEPCRRRRRRRKNHATERLPFRGQFSVLAAKLGMRSK